MAWDSTVQAFQARATDTVIAVMDANHLYLIAHKIF